MYMYLLKVFKTNNFLSEYIWIYMYLHFIIIEKEKSAKTKNVCLKCVLFSNNLFMFLWYSIAEWNREERFRRSQKARVRRKVRGKCYKQHLIASLHLTAEADWYLKVRFVACIFKELYQGYIPFCSLWWSLFSYKIPMIFQNPFYSYKRSKSMI